MQLEYIVQREVRLGQQDTADYRCEGCLLAVLLVEATVHVHPILESDQMPSLDPAREGYACTGIIDSSASSNLPEAFSGEIREVFKGRKKRVFHRLYRIIYKV